MIYSYTVARILSLCFAFFFLSAFKVTRESNGRLTLSASSCEQATKAVYDFAGWKKISDGIQCEPKKINFKEADNQCSVDATNCLPEHVQKYQGVRSELAGPNCWNTVLVMSKILPNHRYTNDKEFAYYMRPPLCRSLKNGEERRPGDIGSISEKAKMARGQGGVTHAFIYISEDLAYAKNNPSAKSPYTLHALGAMQEEYGLDMNSNCFSNVSDADCKVGTKFYRCQSMAEYLKTSQAVPAELAEAFRQSEKIDKCIEHLVMKEAPLTEEAFRSLAQTGEALTRYLQLQRGHSQQPRVGSEEEFMLGALQVRLGSLRDQLTTLHEYPYQKEVDELARLRELISKSDRQ